MKHNVKITAILLLMFVVAQFIGIYVVNYYSPLKVVNGNAENVSAPSLPFGLETPQIETQSEYAKVFPSIIMAFIFAILIFFLLTKFKVKIFLKLWFLLVIFIALSVSFISILSPFLKFAYTISIILAVGLSILKVYGRNFLIHNSTELLVYPGIAAVFVPLLNVWTMIVLLVIISVYDIWAVWHSKIMVKMAKYSMNNLKVFPGFFVPYFDKKMRQKISNWKKTLTKAQLRKKKVKVNVAILGGGDVVFPIITAGVMLKTLGIWSAIFVIVGATLGLTYLFFFSEKKKFYPAMPFITAGILLGILASFLVL